MSQATPLPSSPISRTSDSSMQPTNLERDSRPDFVQDPKISLSDEIEDHSDMSKREEQEVLEEGRKKLKIFQNANKTSYKQDGTERAILGVTSDLAIPTRPLMSITTAQMMEKRAGRKNKLVDQGGMSSHPVGERILAREHKHGFIAAITAAFRDHYPLKLKPQHFWIMVTQAVAIHVELHSEELRSNWVAHEGKKELIVKCHEFVKDTANNWASTVSGKPTSFSAQLEASTVEGVSELLCPPFSNTTTNEDIAQRITIMDISKHYFDFGLISFCGFPEITLEGTEADWRILKEASQKLLGKCTKEFSKQWGLSLFPLMDKLISARCGEVDALFWNSMCKRGGSLASGACKWLNGWFNIFFPYINRKGSFMDEPRHSFIVPSKGYVPNPSCVPYSPEHKYVLQGLVYGKMDYRHEIFKGTDETEISGGMSSAPVTWQYYDEVIPLRFNAGFIGASQDQKTLQISPSVGWYITLDISEETDITDDEDDD